MTTTRQGGPARPSARARLLRAADELFYADGISSTGVDAVVDRAGVATGSLYNNFGGKDGLVAAYLTERDERWRGIWQACVAEQHDPLERVLAVFTAVSRWGEVADVHRGCALLAAAVQLPAEHPGRRVAAAHKEHLSRRLRELCAEARVSDPAGAAQDVLLVYEGLQNFIAMGLDPAPVARARCLAATRLGQPGAGSTE